MSETKIHKQLKIKAAGEGGKVEQPLRSGKILDAKSQKTATEIERSGKSSLLQKAAQRLKESRVSRKVLQVPQPHMKKGVEVMKESKVEGMVKNMSGTKRIFVPKKLRGGI